MDDYAGRVLAGRYRLPLPPSDEYDLVETRAFDGASGQEVLVRQVPLPEVVEAEFVDADGGPVHRRPAPGRGPRRSGDPAVRRAIEAAQAAAQIPDHPRLDQVFDVFEEDGSLWIVSELVAARPLAALLAEAPLSPYRAAEVASDVLTALRVLHAHGWTHRNITVRTVLVCDDGRIVLTGLAAGAAEEALCGYAPIPGAGGGALPGSGAAGDALAPGGATAGWGEASVPVPRGHVAQGDEGLGDTGGAHGSALPALPTDFMGRTAPASDAERTRPHGDRALPPAPAESDPRAARAGAIAAYRAGARAAARATEDQRRQAVEPSRGPYLQDPDSGPGGGTGAAAVSPYGAAAAGTGPVAPYGDSPVRTAAGEPYGRRPGGAVSPYGSAAPAGGPRAEDAARGTDAERGAPAERDAEAGRRAHPGRGPAGERGKDVERVGGQEPAGSWHGALPRSAGGAGGEALRADDLRHSHPGPGRPGGRGAEPPRHPHASQGSSGGQLAVPAGSAKPPSSGGRWDDVIAGLPYRGPSTPLAAERSRQTRIAVVGAVTERWAPEQAGPVYENWQLAPPIGPATDLWALGALLFRVVQGHAPYPEDNAAELVQMVCAEPPAFAEECGPLRPVVESLLRQDPTERPDFEELRGWLRSLVRSAPEPDAGTKVVPLPSSPDAARLPIVRRRGELVRKRRGGSPHGRHRNKQDRGRTKAAKGAGPPRAPRVQREPRIGGRQPRSLGTWLLVLVMAGLAAAVAFAVLFLPKGGEAAQDGRDTGSGQPASSGRPQEPAPGPTDDAPADPPPADDKNGDASPPAGERTDEPPAQPTPASDLPPGYVLRKDPDGFQVAVSKNWQRTQMNEDRQVRYQGNDIELVVVPGRDTVKDKGGDPMAYQLRVERELQPLRDSTWATSGGLKRIGIGQQALAEGQFTWTDSSGRDVFVRNRAMIIAGKYHIVQVIGPDSARDEVTEVFDAAVRYYRPTT
ncbi:protein kinase [Streptomyces sp. CA-294286]|uniref:protein kinase n=1 Tax=Streptomyces sp. CA-294286 TaxID=3240070 RepID=UPI003D8C8271